MRHATAVRPEATEEGSSESFANKPVVLADNGHGTKVKLWKNKTAEGGEFQTVSIERSYKPKGSEEYKTERVSLNGEELLAVARALEKGHDAIVEKKVSSRGQARS